MAFQYNVEAVCTSKLSHDLVLLSITSGILLEPELRGRRKSTKQSSVDSF